MHQRDSDRFFSDTKNGWRAGAAVSLLFGLITLEGFWSTAAMMGLAALMLILSFVEGPHRRTASRAEHADP